MGCLIVTAATAQRRQRHETQKRQQRGRPRCFGRSKDDRVEVCAMHEIIADPDCGTVVEFHHQIIPFPARCLNLIRGSMQNELCLLSTCNEHNVGLDGNKINVQHRWSPS